MAHNTWAVPVCSYFLAAVKWRETEVKQLDVQARGIMRHHKSHYVRAAPEKLYLPVDEGGRGLRSIELTWEKEVVSAASYLLASKDDQMKGAVTFLQKLKEEKGRGCFTRPRRPDGSMVYQKTSSRSAAQTWRRRPSTKPCSPG